MSEPASRLTAFAYAISRAFLGLFVLGALVFIVPTIWTAFSGDGQSVSIGQRVPYDQVESLHPVDGCSDPVCVRAPREVDISILVLNADGTQRALNTVRNLAIVVFVIPFLFVVHNLLGSVRDGDVFSGKNVRRLRMLGLLLLVGWPALEVMVKLIDRALADTTPLGSLGTRWNIPPAPGAIIGGVVVLILAGVFARGVRLREDVEGTI